MRGRKPNLDNVVGFPGTTSDRSEAWHREQALAVRPIGLSRRERQLWETVAVELSKVGRLHKRFSWAIAEWVRLTVRLEESRRQLDADGWTYETTGRHGRQQKSRAEVAQLNDDWRKWARLTSELGLTPAAERGLASGQGDLFDNPFAALDTTSA